MNLSIWDIMAPAFFECLILVGIHSYLGLHVLRRKVIFVDLALAQIAALGTTVGFLFGILPGTTGAYWFSLSFTFIGAAVFSVLRFRHEKIPQEAIIGLAYAIAASVSILVIDKAPHGAEHIKEILTGSILWVKWSTILSAAIVYAFVGIFHYIFRRQFILISENPDEAYNQGLSVKFWDFLFYVSFGVVITHSVGTAGVLLVFVFLVVPAITSMLITDTWWKQLVIGWIMGLIVSVVGLYISYVADLPSGPTVVTFYGITLLIVALILYIVRAEAKANALIKIALGLGTVLVVVFGLYLLGNYFNSSVHAEEHEDLLKKEHMVSHEPVADSKSGSLDALLKQFNASEDDFTKIDIAGKIWDIDKKQGLKLLFQILKSSELPFAREEAVNKLRELSGKNFGYDPEKNKEENSVSLQKWESWINSQM